VPEQRPPEGETDDDRDRQTERRFERGNPKRGDPQRADPQRADEGIELGRPRVAPRSRRGAHSGAQSQRRRAAVGRSGAGLWAALAEDLSCSPDRRRRHAPGRHPHLEEHFGDFWPKGNHFYGPLTSLQPGEVALLDLALPGKMTLSTGVLVIFADDESFAFMTPEGHQFASFITFSSFADDAVPVVQIQALLRASDPLYELSMPIVAQRTEDRFWNDTLQALAAHFGVTGTTVEMQRVCVDRRRQWRYAGNIRQNAAIRTTLHRLTHPKAWFHHRGDA
jgi:hypothetical protein